MKNHFKEARNSYNICIDQGNSSTKIGIFNQNTLIDVMNYEKIDTELIHVLKLKYNLSNCILSSVISVKNDFVDFCESSFDNFIHLSHKTLLPVVNTYTTPETLGKDRIAAVVGASFLQPNKDILVIDIGTAVTYDLITSDLSYLGGNIAPGIDLRLRALHEFTGKLPLIEADIDYPLLGTDTRSAILGGVLQGVFFEIKGYIDILKYKYPELLTFLTGGSIFYFETKLKSPIFAEKNLVLIGLNCILQFNVKN